LHRQQSEEDEQNVDFALPGKNSADAHGVGPNAAPSIASAVVDFHFSWVITFLTSADVSGSEHLNHQERLVATHHFLHNCVDHLAVFFHAYASPRVETGQSQN